MHVEAAGGPILPIGAGIGGDPPQAGNAWRKDVRAVGEGMIGTAAAAVEEEHLACACRLLRRQRLQIGHERGDADAVRDQEERAGAIHRGGEHASGRFQQQSVAGLKLLDAVREKAGLLAIRTSRIAPHGDGEGPGRGGRPGQGIGPRRTALLQAYHHMLTGQEVRQRAAVLWHQRQGAGLRIRRMRVGDDEAALTLPSAAIGLGP